MENNRFIRSLQRFSGILSEQEIQEIIEIQNQPSPTGIRLNALKNNTKPSINELAKRYGWNVSPIPFCENGWVINEAQISPGTTIEHRLGQYYLQDPASMVPVSLFNFKGQSSPLILDMAASPGGKTTHLIDRTQDRGFVIANDASQSRIPALRAVLTNWGAVNIAITQFPGESYGNWFPECFDFILLDAPCSMENLRPYTNHPLRDTTGDERMRLQSRQVQLLTSALGALKCSGQLVYSTCSLAPEEDEAVVDSVNQTFPNAFEIINVSDKFEFDTQGLTGFENHTFDPAISKTVRLWPNKTGMSGFFCALITKTHSIEIPFEAPPRRDFSKTGLGPLSKDDQSHILNLLYQQFKLDLETIINDLGLVLLKRYDQFFLIPQAYLDHFQFLPYAHIGMPIGQFSGDQFEPSHPFISRFGHLFNNGKITIQKEHVSQWISGRDIRYPDTDLIPEGQFLLVTDSSGRNLGLGRLLPKRLRNMLPRNII
jgi:16S rRNA (cytosine1407-C5)-methyltransferase